MARSGHFPFFFVQILVLLISGRGVEGQNCSCADIDKCAPVQPCDPRNEICNTENVAVGKPAYMTSMSQYSGRACHAVNGDTNTVAGCAESGLSDYSAFWAVDLGQNIVVTNITIYRRKNWQTRMADLELRVDESLCYTFPTHNQVAHLLALPEKIDIQCKPALTGRVVKLQKVNTDNTDKTLYSYLINICEVQVWECTAGYFGKTCTPCSEHCIQNSTCDTVTGECSGGCLSGWQGPRCDQDDPAEETAADLAAGSDYEEIRQRQNQYDSLQPLEQRPDDTSVYTRPVFQRKSETAS